VGVKYFFIGKLWSISYSLFYSAKLSVFFALPVMIKSIFHQRSKPFLLGSHKLSKNIAAVVLRNKNVPLFETLPHDTLRHFASGPAHTGTMKAWHNLCS